MPYCAAIINVRFAVQLGASSNRCASAATFCQAGGSPEAEERLFNVDLHQIIGCKHHVLAFIKYPWTHSDGQPVPGMFDGIITSWEKERNSPEHRQRVEISRSLTFEKAEKKRAAHIARRDHEHALRIERGLGCGHLTFEALGPNDRRLLQDLRSGELKREIDRSDAAFGWNLQKKTAVGSAAARIYHEPRRELPNEPKERKQL